MKKMKVEECGKGVKLNRYDDEQEAYNLVVC